MNVAQRTLTLDLLVLLPALALVWRGSLVQQKMEILAVRQKVLATARLAASSEECFPRYSQRLLANVMKFQFLTLATNRPFCEGRLGNLLLLQPDYADSGLIENDENVFCRALKTNYPQSMERDSASGQSREQIGRLLEGSNTNQVPTSRFSGWDVRSTIQMERPVVRFMRSNRKGSI